MPYTETYREQVALLTRALPYIAAEPCFALKGGTAINLFIRNMPRLSVDIDLTYLPVEPRDESLKHIDAALRRIAAAIRAGMPNARVGEQKLNGEDAVVKLNIRLNEVQIKVEVTPVLRGCVFEPAVMQVSPQVEDDFGYAEIKIVSFADLYGGKILAALDRQHPRDLFDVRDLLRNEGISDDLRKAIIVYLLSHPSPMAEVLGSKQKDISHEYDTTFAGMTEETVSIDELVAARAQLIKDVVGNMPTEHREFLLSFERGKPRWDLLDLAGVADLPAVKWRQQNLDKLSPEKRAELVEKLEAVLT